MGKRYLMRLGKNPFEPVDGFHSYDRDTIGRNNGNLIYGAAAHKLFSTDDTQVDANHYQIDASMADEVNAEYDGFILPLANALRIGFEAELRRTTEFIERLRIPFLMLSGGAQLPMNGNPAGLRRLEPAVKRFARAVLDKSSALSVRGELSAEYLRSLGFNDAMVVRCPSMTMNGPGHHVEVPTSLERGAPIAYNIQPPRLDGAGLVGDAEANYCATYFPQDVATLEFMLWGSRPYTATDGRLPLEPDHRQFSQRKAEYHLDAYSWIKRLAQMQFSFGLRAHGNIAAILGGTPALLLAHDGRTVELARYHGIPHIEFGGETDPATVDELFGRADFTEFNRGHTERFDRMSKFIHDNGFDHIYDPGQVKARAEYEQRMERTSFPDPQRPIWVGKSKESVQLAAALQDRYKELKAANKELTAANKDLTEKEQQLERRFERLQEHLEGTDRQLTKTRHQLTEVSKRATRTQHRLDRVLRVPAKVKRTLTPWRRRSPARGRR